MPLAVADLGAPPPLWLLAPFLILILGIALGPLLLEKFWHKNYPLVSLVLALVVLLHYLRTGHLFEAAAAAGEEYISFIALIGSLFVVAGGIQIGV